MRSSGPSLSGETAAEHSVSRQTHERSWASLGGGSSSSTSWIPHLARGFSPTNAGDRDTWAIYITPDATITRETDDAFEIEVIESRRFVLHINPVYTRAADWYQHPQLRDTDEKKNVQYVGSAMLFIGNINQRRQTMFMITTCIVERRRA